MVDECLKARPHKIEDRDVECKRAIPKQGIGAQALPELHVTSNKVGWDLTVYIASVMLYFFKAICYQLRTMLAYITKNTGFNWLLIVGSDERSQMTGYRPMA